MPDSLFNNVTLLIKGTAYDDNQTRDHSKFYMAAPQKQGAVSESSVVLQWDPTWADTSIGMSGNPPTQINVPLCPVNGVASRTFPATGHHTHELFVNCESWNNYAIASCCDENLTNGWVLSLTSNGNVRFRTFGYGNDLTITTDWEFQAWTWTHIAIIRTTQGGRFGFRLMVDRQMTPFIEDSLANPYVPYTATPLVIGAAGTMQRMIGNFCQYRITDGAERYATPPPASIYTTAFPGLDDWPAPPAFTPPASPTGLVGWGVGWGGIRNGYFARENSPINAFWDQSVDGTAMCFGPTGPFTTFTWTTSWSAGALANPFANPNTIVADVAGARIVSINEAAFPSGLQVATINTFYDGQPSNTLTISKSGSGLTLTSQPFTPQPPVVLPTSRVLYTWGESSSGETGQGGTVDVLSPTQVAGAWIALSMGINHSLAVAVDGTLWAWGDNNYGQCGTPAVSPFRRTSPTQVGTDTDWSKVAAGNGYSLAIKANGALYGFGFNVGGRMAGIASGTTPLLIHAGPWAKVISAYDITVGLRTNGTLWSTGGNGSGELGIYNDYSQKTSFTAESRGYTDWVDLCTTGQSGGSIFAMRSGGALYYTGSPYLDGVAGALDEARYNLSAPGPWLHVRTNGEDVLGVKTDGTLWAWGENAYGKLGNGTTTPNISTPTQVGTATNWVMVAVAGQNAAAINSDGEIFVWGDGSSGGLGDGLTANSYTPKKVTGPWGTAVQVALSGYGAVGILAAPPVAPPTPPAPKALYTWGENTSGEAGVGTLVDVLSPTQITGSWRDLSMGSEHSLAVRADGTLWAWGENFSSQCGQSGVDRFPSPVQVGTDTDWAKVAAGNGYSIALKANGAMYGFGSTSNGNMAQLPGGPTPALIDAGPWASVSTGSARTTGIRTNGTLWSTGFNTAGQLGVGDFTSKSVLTQESRAYTNWSKVVSRQPASGATFALRVGGALYYAGNPYLDGVPTSVQDGMFTLAAAGPWLDVQVNGTNAIGVKTDGTLWTWGNNALGVLGNGNTTSALSAPAQIGTATNWVGVAMGDWNAAAYNASGEVFVWGNGSKGGIGNGLTTNNLTPTLVNGPWIGTGTVAGVFVSERGTVGVLTTLPTIDPPDPEPIPLPTTTPRFNTEFRYGLSGGPGFSTTVVTSVSGHESSNSHWSIPLGKWTTGPDLYTRLELVDIYNFFMICRGQAQAFRFKAWEDFEASGDEGRTSLTATANVLQLFKRYQVVAAMVDVPIRRPVPLGFQLWSQDPTTLARTLLVRETDYNIDFETGLITGRTDADAPNLRWTGTFDKWVKFTTDHLPCEFVNFREEDGERLFSISGLGIREIRQ